MLFIDRIPERTIVTSQEKKATSIEKRRLRESMSSQGLAFSKARGQNFLADKRTLSNMAACLPDDREAMTVEVGTGLGSLTSMLSNRFGKLITYEIDSGIIKALENVDLADAELRHDDFLKTNMYSLRNEAKEFGLNKLFLIGNLPYSSGTRILINSLISEQLDLMVFMLQKEVVLRALAPVGSKDYGILSALCSIYTKPSKAFDIPPACFTPRPRVWSSVLKLESKAPPSTGDADISGRLVLSVLKAAFAQRRKKIANSLSSAFEKSRVARSLDEAGIPAGERAENVIPENFFKLARAIARD